MTARLPEVLAHAKFEDIVSELVNPYPREPGSVWQWAIPTQGQARLEIADGLHDQSAQWTVLTF